MEHMLIYTRNVLKQEHQISGLPIIFNMKTIIFIVSHPLNTQNHYSITTFITMQLAFMV